MSGLFERVNILDDKLQRALEGDLDALKDTTLVFQNLRREAKELTQHHAELLTLYEVGREIATILDLDQLLESIMDRAIMLVQAERGFVVLWNAEAEDFEIAVAREFSARGTDDAQVEISFGIIRRVMTTHEPIITTNAQEDPRFQKSQSIVSYRIRSVLAVPMLVKDELIGAIYVDTRFTSHIFEDSDLDLLSAMANQAAVAIRMARLVDDLQAKNRELEAALKELRETQDQLIQAERLSVVGRMASAIIHDIKNPMTTIKGFADLLGKDDLSPDARRRFSKMISRSVDGFVDMTQEILDYARGESELELKPVRIKSFVDDLTAFIGRDFALKNITIETDLPADKPVIMDANKMQRVMFNIANNAADAMGSGGTFTIAAQVSNGQVKFRLSDTGPGIPEEIAPTIFEPFVTHGKQYGTGLGLAIAKKIVEDHGGTIGLEKDTDRGATFVITLPAKPAPPIKPPSSSPSPSRN